MNLSTSWASTSRSTQSVLLSSRARATPIQVRPLESGLTCLLLSQQACLQQQTKESNVMESPPSRPISAPADHTRYEIRSLPSPTTLPQGHVCRNAPPACDYHDDAKGDILTHKLLDLSLIHIVLCFSAAAEDHYDVLPIRKGMIATVLWALPGIMWWWQTVPAVLIRMWTQSRDGKPVWCSSLKCSSTPRWL